VPCPAFYYRALSPSLAVVAASLAGHWLVDTLTMNFLAGVAAKVVLISTVSLLVFFKIGGGRESAV
jgi:hypothetical protein